MNIDPFEKDKLLQAIEVLRSFIENLEEKKSCGSCVHYIENDGHCKKYKQVIPEHVLINGCEGWEFHSIPF